MAQLEVVLETISCSCWRGLEVIQTTTKPQESISLEFSYGSMSLTQVELDEESEDETDKHESHLFGRSFGHSRETLMGLDSRVLSDT